MKNTRLREVAERAPQTARVRHVHPFPARMAPELALDAIQSLSRRSLILDPMCGSGTVLRHAVEAGHRAKGFDLDPLAVMMSRVACRKLKATTVVAAGDEVVAAALSLRSTSVPWIDGDAETKAFVDFWFAQKQQEDLRRLAIVLAQKRGPTADCLRVAFSRIIITKASGASLARDVSHSRPHRVALETDYDVMPGFCRAVRKVAEFVDRPIAGAASVALRDARLMPAALNGSVDLVVTSPPYLNAIDYMRGHRLSLVWFGHTMSSLREVRTTSVGTERIANISTLLSADFLQNYVALTARQVGMIRRYANDMHAFMANVRRVLAPKGEAIAVVGDSTLRGVFIENSEIVAQAAEAVGLQVINRTARSLPPNSRYMPPPAANSSSFDKRMRTEVVLHFAKS